MDEQEKKTSRTQTSTPPSSDEIVTGITEVANAALGVGAALAKTIARATATNHVLPEPVGKGSPIDEMVFYSVKAVTNVLGLAISGAGAVTQVVREQKQPVRTPQAPLQPAAMILPTVHRGSTLRMPLSIENQSNEPMNGMTFVCLSVKGEPQGPGEPLDERSVRFQPATLDVSPRDFEKLTVFVDTSTETALGRYEAIIGLGKGIFENKVQFEVLPAVNPT